MNQFEGEIIMLRRATPIALNSNEKSQLLSLAQSRVSRVIQNSPYMFRPGFARVNFALTKRKLQPYIRPVDCGLWEKRGQTTF